MMSIEFKDEENIYGRIETEEDPDKIKDLLEEYKKDEEEYNIDGFFEFLESRDIKFDIVNSKADREFDF